MERNLINVGLYGSGTRDSRRRAEYIYCDSADQCSAYKEGKCFCVTAPFSIRCGVGSVSCIDGGTKQSKAFARVGQEARNNECYAKLSYPHNTYVTRIADKVFLTIPCTWMELSGDVLYVKDPHLMTNKLLMDADLLTPDNIKRICTAQPRALMGGVIRDYQNKTVPMFLHQLKLVFPEKYRAFAEEHPDYQIKPPNWIGRRAKLITCKKGETYLDTSKNPFVFDGEWLTCESYKSAFTPFGPNTCTVKIRANEDMVVTISSNEQVTEDTVFV